MPFKKWNDYSQFSSGSMVGGFEVMGSNWMGHIILSCPMCGMEIKQAPRALMGRAPVCRCKGAQSTGTAPR